VKKLPEQLQPIVEGLCAGTPTMNLPDSVETKTPAADKGTEHEQKIIDKHRSDSTQATETAPENKNAHQDTNEDYEVQEVREEEHRVPEQTNDNGEMEQQIFEQPGQEEAEKQASPKESQILDVDEDKKVNIDEPLELEQSKQQNEEEQKVSEESPSRDRVALEERWKKMLSERPDCELVPGGYGPNIDCNALNQILADLPSKEVSLQRLNDIEKEMQQLRTDMAKWLRKDMDEKFRGPLLDLHKYLTRDRREQMLSETNNCTEVDQVKYPGLRGECTDLKGLTLEGQNVEELKGIQRRIENFREQLTKGEDLPHSMEHSKSQPEGNPTREELDSVQQQIPDFKKTPSQPKQEDSISSSPDIDDDVKPHQLQRVHKSREEVQSDCASLDEKKYKRLREECQDAQLDRLNLTESKNRTWRKLGPRRNEIKTLRSEFAKFQWNEDLKVLEDPPVWAHLSEKELPKVREFLKMSVRH